MICPNCGRELPDTARICPGCSAVQRVTRRAPAEVDLPREQESVRVKRRVAPDKDLARHKGEQEKSTNRGTVSTPDRTAEPKRKGTSASASRVPVGLSRQEERRQAEVRHVRRAPDHIRRKVDARPAMLQPPIYQRSHKRLRRVVFAVVLVLVFAGSACGYMLFGSESGQRLMAQWGWSVARTDAYVTYG